MCKWNENTTAINRLAQINMSVGEYKVALFQIRSVWENGNRNNVTRLLYSDALVANGDLDGAAKLLQAIPTAEDRLLYQSWYRYNKNQDYMRASYALQTVLLINPANSEAKTRLDKVQKIINQ